MVDAELGLALVFNGTIYNYRALRRELEGRGYRFFSEGDSEVILKAWHAWGTDCCARLHGMFAFAVWDANQQVLFLARDRFGIKPLYWSEQAGRCVSPPAPRRSWRAAGWTRPSIRSHCIISSRCMPWSRRRAPSCAGCASSRPDTGCGSTHAAAGPKAPIGV
jgi:asparagine synthase (glutamine-hydrolysing)